MGDKKRRSVIKAISWRVTGTVDTFLLSLFITGEISYASAISLTEVVTKILLYYGHERVWSFIKWGTPKHSSTKIGSEVLNET